MENEKICPGTLQDPDLQDPSRRNFLKQSGLLTAVALTPATALKAANEHVDDKIAGALEKMPL
ncbi:MAG: 2Fe-2S ferredoxin, partial [Mucilaginibacter sp.]|nr:2Fe-2S ferredoxin [Mucilaginibacter sp.]